MMRILVLHGMQSTGKSTTLNLLYAMLVTAMAKSHNNRKVLGDPSQKDFSETITYHNDEVEFFTMGDYPKQLEIAVRNAAKRNITVFICACSRLSPSLISEFQRHRTTFLSKTISLSIQQQGIFNTADAQTLFNMI